MHRIKFGQPIDHEEVSSFSLLEVNPKKDDDMNKIFLLCREGISSAAMDAYHQHTQILNRYTVAQIILTNHVVSTIRKEIRKLYPDQKIDNQQIIDILNNEILKRDVIEGEKAQETQQKLKKITAKYLKQAEKKMEKSETPVVVELPEFHKEIT